MSSGPHPGVEPGPRVPQTRMLPLHQCRHIAQATQKPKQSPVDKKSPKEPPLVEKDQSRTLFCLSRQQQLPMEFLTPEYSVQTKTIALTVAHDERNQLRLFLSCVSIYLVGLKDYRSLLFLPIASRSLHFLCWANAFRRIRWSMLPVYLPSGFTCSCAV